MTWLDVDGWLSVEEGQALQLLAVGATVLELGSWKGRSTCCMAAVAKIVVAVDWFGGDSGCGWADTLLEFRRNLKACGGPAKVTTMVGRIEALDAEDGTPPDGPFDLVYVDDDHEQAERSTRLALRCLKPGGVIAWHDWDYPEVRTGVMACGLNPASFRGRLAWQRMG